MSKKGLGKLVLGAGIGASLALLFAPKKGSDLRNDIKKKINEGTPVPYLMLRHKDKKFADFVWHWFLCIGYER